MAQSPSMPKKGTSAETWHQVQIRVRELETLLSIDGLLNWDQGTYLPNRGAVLRGEQLAMISTLSHQRWCDPILSRLVNELPQTDAVHVAAKRNLTRRIATEQLVSEALVQDLAKARAEGYAAWVDAKKNSSFAAFLPYLIRLVELTKLRAEAVAEGTSLTSAYDALLEEYDPDSRIAALGPMFERLTQKLSPLASEIVEHQARGKAARTADLSLIDGVSEAQQWPIMRAIATAFGYDLEAGRIDLSPHPFSSGLGDGDSRITVALRAHDLIRGIGGLTHETGHALYEQGLPKAKLPGTTIAEAASYALHESQSRLWENFIGRSVAFANWLTPIINRESEIGLTPQRLHEALNCVSRTLIRTEADEVTYNLHVAVRFELEVGLFEGHIKPAEVRDAWNDRYQTYLGVTPPTDSQGVLQDVHWSSGLFGYFPSYAMGNLYAAAIGDTIEAQTPHLWARVEAGDFSPILGWLREHIHSVGHLYEAPEIMTKAVGETDYVDTFVRYLRKRHLGSAT